MDLSKRILNVSPSLTLKITAKAKALKAEGVDVISFGAGEPDFDTPDFIKEKAIEAIKGGFTRYTPASGIPELKKAIVNKLKNENGLEYSEKNIIVSCGAKHSLFNLFQVILNEGDEVIIPAPYWLSYPEMVKLGGGVPVAVKTGRDISYKITPELLNGAITAKTKAVILNSPSNPTGAVYSEDELKALAEILRDKDIYVVSDEIYENLTYGIKHVSIASVDEEMKEKTIVINGVSKSYAMTGWRIGYMAAPADVANSVSSLQSHSTSNPTSFAQIGALAAIEAGPDSVKYMTDKFKERRELILREAKKIDKFGVFEPSGAFYIFCDVSAVGMPSLEFADKLLEEAKVAVIPSEPFGIDNHIRLSFAVSDKNIVNGLKRIGDFIVSL